MEDFNAEDFEEQLKDFNELYKFATVIATTLGNRVTFAEKERDEVKAELKKVNDTNKNISAELAKCQSELENLREQNQKLSSDLENEREENRNLQDKLQKLTKIILEG